MTTVLVVPDGTKEVVREDWEVEGRDAPHRLCHRRSDRVPCSGSCNFVFARLPRPFP